MRAQLALCRARRPLEGIRGLAQMLAVAHELELAQRRGSRALARRGRAAPHDGRDAFDRHDVGLVVHEMDEQPRKFSELRTLGIGPAALGDLARRVRDRRRRHLKQLGDRVAKPGGRCALPAGAACLADRLLDALEQIRQGWQVVQGRESTQRLQRLEHLLQRIVRQRIRAQGTAGAIERARDRGAFTRHERACPRVEAHRLHRADLGRWPAAQLLELGGHRLGLRRVLVRPRRGFADEDLEVVDGSDGDLLDRRVPRPPALAHAPRERFETHRCPRDRLLVRHQGAAAERAREPHQLVGRGRRRGLEQSIEPVEIFPRLEGEEVAHAERLGCAWLSHGGTT